jgi:dihydrolipoamide dehydrogenase
VTQVRGSAPAVLETERGDQLAADRILLAAGRKPRLDMGIDELGLDPEEPLQVDGRLRVMVSGTALPDVFAIGDLTGIAPYTHTANYHARTVAAHLIGPGLDADHTGIPRVVYTEPAVLCAGITVAQAEAAGTPVRTARFDATRTSRSALEVRDGPAGVELVADARTGTLLGIAAVGPEADSWAAELALAVRTRVTVHELAQALHAFPSWTEAIHPPARQLASEIPASGSRAGGRP